MLRQPAKPLFALFDLTRILSSWKRAAKTIELHTSALGEVRVFELVRTASQTSESQKVLRRSAAIHCESQATDNHSVKQL